LFLLLVGVIMFLPMWNVIVVSTTTALEASRSGVHLWWREFSIEGFRYVFEVTKLARPFLNSLFVTTVGTVIQVLLASFAGYVLIQRDLPFKNGITSFIMLTMMIPGDLTMISIYQLNRDLGLLNSYTGLILNGLIAGSSILLMRNYFKSISYTLAESARIDGASELRIFAGIFLPISLPGLATVFFMDFVSRWNSITIPAAILTDESMYTLPLKLKAMILSTSSVSGTAQIPENAIMAAIVITAVPLLLLLLIGLLVSGRKRKQNEDAAWFDEKRGVFVVADGMGGHLAGEVASQMAIDAVRRMAARHKKPSVDLLKKTVLGAHERIYLHAQGHAECAGMGTTISMMWRGGGYMYIAHVGDSRIYRLRDGHMEQITQDHSLVGELVRAGLLTPEEARLHPRRNIITRALGTEGDNTPDLLAADIRPGDRFLLCTDGLTGMVRDDDIERMLLDSKTIDQAANRLVEMALDAGGSDNVTLILCTGEEGKPWRRD
ncbi:MAG: Stp1/IreP family PP2C-type Ser/Thr phosphatase, partial [Clostridiales bacterium]|nr:Stp1/IreP family PP2C-type Ser/Thr phosphatase [Clostridiales bacterium]